MKQKISPLCVPFDSTKATNALKTFGGALQRPKSRRLGARRLWRGGPAALVCAPHNNRKSLQIAKSENKETNIQLLKEGRQKLKRETSYK
jgi:hypothetical protein